MKKTLMLMMLLTLVVLVAASFENVNGKPCVISFVGYYL